MTIRQKRQTVKNAAKNPTAKPESARGKLKPAKPHKGSKLIPHRTKEAFGHMPPEVTPNLAPKKKRKQVI